MFRQRVFNVDIHILNELKTKKNPLIDTQKAKGAQVSDSCIVPQLAVPEGDCKFCLRRDDSVFYCQTGNPLASVCSQLQDEKHKGMRPRKILGPSRQNQD